MFVKCQQCRSKMKTTPYQQANGHRFCSRSCASKGRDRKPNSKAPLAKVTPEALRPLWDRKDIPVRRIAEALGVTRQAVVYRAKMFGFPNRYGNQTPMKKCRDAEFIEAWEAGLSVNNIARLFGYSRSGAVSTRRSRLGLAPRTSGHRPITPGRFAEMQLLKRMSESKR